MSSLFTCTIYRHQGSDTDKPRAPLPMANFTSESRAVASVCLLHSV